MDRAKFDNKKAYVAQEEKGESFVLPSMHHTEFPLTRAPSLTMGEKLTCFILCTATLQSKRFEGHQQTS